MSVVGRVIQQGPASVPSYPPQFNQAVQYPAPQWGAPCPPWQCAWNASGAWYPQMQSQWAPAMPAPPSQYLPQQQFVTAESESEDDVEVVGARGGFNTQQDFRYVESTQTLSGVESVDEGLSSTDSTARSRSSSRGGSSRRGRAASLSRDECEGIPVCHTRSHSSPPCRDYLK